MKHLPKHLRPGRRYIALGLESWPDADVDQRSFQRAVWYAAQNLLGDPGAAAVDLNVIRFRFDDGAGEAVVRTHRGTTDRARAALACVSDVDGHEIGVRVRGISGTVRGCEEKYLGRAPERSEERNVVFENEKRTAVVRPPRVDVRDGASYLGATELDFE